jgi:hypothetical protein
VKQDREKVRKKDRKWKGSQKKIRIKMKEQREWTKKQAMKATARNPDEMLSIEFFVSYFSKVCWPTNINFNRQYYQMQKRLPIGSYVN